MRHGWSYELRTRHLRWSQPQSSWPRQPCPWRIAASRRDTCSVAGDPCSTWFLGLCRGFALWRFHWWSWRPRWASRRSGGKIVLREKHVWQVVVVLLLSCYQWQQRGGLRLCNMPPLTMSPAVFSDSARRWIRGSIFAGIILFVGLRGNLLLGSMH